MIGTLIAAAILAAGLAAPAFARERFTATVTGQGADVILIPSLASSGAVWDATVKQFAPSHRVHILQVAGFAGAPAAANAEGPVLAPLIEEVAAYATKLQKPAIIGHSLGGLVALEVAQRRPESVAKIMIVDALPFYALLYGPMATAELVEPQARTMRDQVLGQSDAAYAAGVPATARIMAKSEAGRALAAEWTLKSDRRVTAAAMYEDMITDARPRLPAINAPTTILYAWDAQMGRTTGYVDQMYSGAYANLPGANLKRVDGSFHFIMLDQPETFAREVEAFLQ